MSRYTTEVRYICETYAGLKKSADYCNIEDIIDKALPKILKYYKSQGFTPTTVSDTLGLV